MTGKVVKQAHTHAYLAGAAGFGVSAATSDSPLIIGVHSMMSLLSGANAYFTSNLTESGKQVFAANQRTEMAKLGNSMIMSLTALGVGTGLSEGIGTALQGEADFSYLKEEFDRLMGWGGIISGNYLIQVPPKPPKKKRSRKLVENPV